MWILIAAWAAVPFLILRFVLWLILAVVRLMIRAAQASNARQAQLRPLEGMEYELRRLGWRAPTPAASNHSAVRW